MPLPFRLPDETAVQSLVLQPDGRVVVQTVLYGGSEFGGLVALSADGSRVDTLAAPGAGQGLLETHALARQPDGRLLLGGYFPALGDTTAEGAERENARVGGLWCLGPNGYPAPGFDAYAAAPWWQADALAIRPNNQLVVGGVFFGWRRLFGRFRRRPELFQLQPDGCPDPAFASVRFSRYTRLAALAVQADGRVLLGTVSHTVYRRNQWRHHRSHDWSWRERIISRRRWARQHAALRRYGSDGHRDRTFRLTGLQSDRGTAALLVLPDGGVLVSGDFAVPGHPRRPRYLARLRPDGSLDPGFGP